MKIDKRNCLVLVDDGVDESRTVVIREHVLEDIIRKYININHIFQDIVVFGWPFAYQKVKLYLLLKTLRHSWWQIKFRIRTKLYDTTSTEQYIERRKLLTKSHKGQISK